MRLNECIFVWLYVCKSVCLYSFMFVCLYVCASNCLFICMSVCSYGYKFVFVSMFVYLSMCNKLKYSEGKQLTQNGAPVKVEGGA